MPSASRWIGVASLVFNLGGCSGCDAEVESASGPTTATGAAPAGSEIKLVDRLESATIESVWAEVRDADADGIEGRSLLHVDFERGREADLGWQRNPRLRIVRRGTERGRALSVRPPEGIPPAILIDVAPSSLVRVARTIKGDPNVVDLGVLETTVRPKDSKPHHPGDLKRILHRGVVAGTHVNLAVLLRRHRIGSRSPSAGWRRDRLDLLTGPDTRSLLLLLRGAESAASTSEVLIDDIDVTTLEPTTAQRLALARRRFGLAGAGGIVAFDQFLPLPGRRASAHEAADNYEYRHGLVVPPPTSITWPLAVPPLARLSFAVGLAEGSAPNSEATWRVRLGATILAEGTITSSGGRCWAEQVVDLGARAGEQVDLALETNGDAGAIPVISNPTVWRPRRPGDPPDVYLFAVDTLRADRLSAYGHDRPTSPHLERLARDGVLFENAIAQSNWTPESFAGLFTSSYGHQHGVTERMSMLERNELAYIMRQAGYYTQGIAYKLLLYDMGFERGFDAYFNRPEFHLARQYDIHAERSWRRLQPWLAAQATRRKFLFFHLNDPHQPFNHRGASVARFTGDGALARRGLGLPILIRNHSVEHGVEGRACKGCAPGGRFASWFEQLAGDLYDEEVLFTDHHLGLFIAELERLGLYEDSLIVVLADHGEMLAEHDDYIGHGHHRMYDELLHVPLVIKAPAPAGLEPGQRVSQQVRLVDVMPTILELAGLPVPPGLEGRSLVPAMRGEAMPIAPVVSENVHARVITVRTPSHKLHLRYEQSGPQERFFDLAADPGEQRPIAGADGEVRANLREYAVQHIARTHPGSFLIVSGEPGAFTGRVLLAASDRGTTVESLVGGVKAREDGTWQVSPARQGPVWLAVRVIGDPESNLRLIAGDVDHTFEPLARWPAYDASADRALGKGVRARVVGSAERERETKNEISGEELEALEALGYIEG